MNQFLENSPTPALLDWLLNGQTGNSSKTMVACHLGFTLFRMCVPGDENDLLRCIRLVEVCPEIRESFTRIAKLDPVWQVVTTHWDSLKQTCIDNGMLAMGDQFRELTRP